MSREFTSGNSFNVYIWNMPIHVESASLSITDNTAMVTTHGVPDGYVFGDVEASGEMELDWRQFKRIEGVARAAGSYRDIPTFDMVIYANRGGSRVKVEAFGCKLKISDVLDIDPKGGEKSKVKIEYMVTCKNFVRINGIPYLSPDETNFL